MHAPKAWFTQELSSLAWSKVMNVLKKSSRITASWFGFNMDVPECICACHFEVEHPQDKQNPPQSVLGTVFNNMHLL